MSGCTTWQGLRKVKKPLALLHIMIDVNQALVFALFMAIIAAFIGLTVDFITTMWSNKRKLELGLA